MIAPAPANPHRRGACPGLSAPMPTGDGLLVRLSPIGTIPLASFTALCEAARRHGNGVIEVTSRGNIQVRGLSEASAPQFAAAVAALDIAAEGGVPVLCNPLAGLGAAEIFDSTALATELRHAIAQRALAAKLSPKVSIVVDGGGSGLANVAADIRLCAQVIGAELLLRVSGGGDEATATRLGYAAPAQALEVALLLLGVIARYGRTARARDILAGEGVNAFAAAGLRTTLPGHDGGGDHANLVGLHRLHDGKVARGIALAFGHADATSLERLAEAAQFAGAAGFRTAPGRTLLAVGLTQETESAFADTAIQHGFITRGDDPRRNVIACAGAPICASAHFASRVLAPAVAATGAAQRGTVHLSGCAKGCAHAAPASLTAVGTAEGCALIANGSVRDEPFTVVAANALPQTIADYMREHANEIVQEAAQEAAHV
jgi:precorrin-3B synthase